MKNNISLKLFVVCNLLFCLFASNIQAKSAGPDNMSGDDKLSRKEVEAVTAQELADYIDCMRDSLEEMWKQRKLRVGGLEMPFNVRVLGEKPVSGRSLYISMHGGGAVAKEFNDSQWKNQINLYTPKEGVYIAPRAPYDDWNMWFRKEIDDFFIMLIMASVIFEDVNPDRVYLTGYSAGGDGVWRMAPRMADRWAAASMMAGHPGEVSLLNLRNLPFMIWMGENDKAYDRNKLAVVKGHDLDSLHALDPEGYLHQTNIVGGKGHWMDRADTAAIEWMAQFDRNAEPDKVVWRQEETTRNTFYWLKVGKGESKPGMKVVARIDGNTIYIDECDYDSLYICLNDSLLDLDRKISVKYCGKTIFRGKAKRKRSIIRKSLYERADPRQIYSAEISLSGLKATL